MAGLKEAFLDLDAQQSQFYQEQQAKYQELEPNRLLPDVMKGNIGADIVSPAMKTLSDYDPIEKNLSVLTENGKKIGVDTKKCNSMLHAIIKSVAVEKNGVIEELKALKTETEREGMRRCNIKDCAAIMKYFAFL